jgi:purine-cytosine permease-like protein
MLRFVPVVIVGTVCASAAFGAGAVADMPAIAEFAFVTCLALFFAAVLAGTTNAASSEGDYADQQTMVPTRARWPRVGKQ